LSWNDGFYSNRYNWVSGLITWTFNSSNALTFIGSGNAGETGYGSTATPMFQNNDRQLDNIIYSYTAGALIAQGYAQYSETKVGRYIGIEKAASTWGAGLLLNYSVPQSRFSLSGRAEYNSSSGSDSDGSPNLLYGPGSKAYSFTFTPSYQEGIFFLRVEASFVKAMSATMGDAFGRTGSGDKQARVAIESGILF
jgi:hypothetical protein